MGTRCEKCEGTGWRLFPDGPVREVPTLLKAEAKTTALSLKAKSATNAKDSEKLSCFKYGRSSLEYLDIFITSKLLYIPRGIFRKDFLANKKGENTNVKIVG